MGSLRIVFMGTADLSCASLRALLDSPGFNVAAVVTQPDQPKGRGLKLQASPVKELAQQTGLPILQPPRARDENFLRDLQPFAPDLIVVTAYGQILPRTILDLPRFGCLNVHTSLLPKYRGAAPIQWAIINGESETGVTIMKMDVGMDTGDILAQQKTPIAPNDNSQTLHERLGTIGAALLTKTIPEYVSGRLQPRPQPTEEVSYAPRIKKSDGQMDWSQSAVAIWNRVRGLVPWPGAFTHLPDSPHPHLLKIWSAEPVAQSGSPGEIVRADRDGIVVGTAQGALRILTLQREGGRRMTAHEFLVGHPLRPGDRLI